MNLSQISKTEKLYDTDAYADTFDATVISCDKSRNNFEVVLDRTLFFPEAGGQSCDIGTINGAAVKHVTESGNNIIHILENPIEIGSHITGKINFEHRYRNMQHHSGEHIVSGIVHSEFGIENVGFHLGKSDVTMDYNAELTEEMLLKVEKLANRAIYKNIEIIAKYPDFDELSAVEFRSKLEFAPGSAVRLIIIPGIDICACCAPHVVRTGEIGIIKFIDFYKYKGGTRVHMLCGSDALADYGAKHKTLSALSATLSAKVFETNIAAQRLLDENSRLLSEINGLTKRLCAVISNDAIRTAAPEKGICIFEQNISVGGMRMIANDVAEKCLFCAVFTRNASSGTLNFIITAKNGFSAKHCLSILTEKFAAKGGGSDISVQGSVPDSDFVSEKAIKEALLL